MRRKREVSTENVTREICERAWECVTASLAASARNGVVVQTVGTIIVLDMDGNILFKGRVDDQAPEASRYDEAAESLARNGLSVWAPIIRRIANPSVVIIFEGDQAGFKDAVTSLMITWIEIVRQHELDVAMELDIAGAEWERRHA